MIKFYKNQDISRWGPFNAGYGAGDPRLEALPHVYLSLLLARESSAAQFSYGRRAAHTDL